MEKTNTRIESETEVKAYIQNLKFALDNGAKINFQARRLVDERRDERYTNQYTVNKLFPDENPVDALKRELLTLSVEDYMRTVKDLRFPKRSEMREFGKVYNGADDVYIKIRVELLGMYGDTTTFVMSFHFAERPFIREMFPYKKDRSVFMDMKIIRSEKKLCPCCMEEHEVKTVLVMDYAVFKNTQVQYEASYLFCDEAEELYMDEQQMRDNDVKMKDAYRKEEGLLTASEISAIRAKYGISQSDLCILLGWGGKTITRYESHQVQDRAHDTILKKIDNDPEWFLSLLRDAKHNLPVESYRKYLESATLLYEKDQDEYLRKAIEASYARFQGDQMAHGNVELSLDKVVDVIRYFASSVNVTNLYKVKLMKLMWYADALAYKRRGAAITGLVYQALPMGAVPVGHNSIINLKDIPCEEVDMGETNAYHFSLKGKQKFPALLREDKDILDFVIEKLGKMSKNEIINFMHKEQAYTETSPREVIQFKYAASLQI